MNGYSLPMHEGRQLPQFTLREIDLPDLVNWEVGGEYYIVMKVAMKGKRIQDESASDADAHKVEGDFEMHSIKPLGNKPVDAKELESEYFERVKAEALHNY